MQQLRLFGLWSLFLVVGAGPVCADKPNIIVIYTDDHGYADLSCQGVVKDIRTPNVDALAKSGVLVRHGYSTAPQCVPSRAGLLVGKIQSKFGVEANKDDLAGFDRELTIAERLQKAGYITAQFGKWHLGPTPKITTHGFRHVFAQNAQRPFSANIDLDGKDRKMSPLAPEMYHVDGCSRAAASIIERYNDEPFFLYVAYRAPHVPLDAPQKYLDRFPGKMPRRRRQALAMLSAVDDGVGLITRTLAKHDLTKKTMIFYIGDNGAPLKIHKEDKPGRGAGWDGSLNDPLNGEKGMLSEGGMHVPFVISWPGTIPEGQVFEHPITALDVAATAAALAKLDAKPDEFDGVDLLPYLTGKEKGAPHESLMWRWGAQSAIRSGKWKLLRGGDREYLYDLDADLPEKSNLAAKHPDIAARLRDKLTKWSKTLKPPGLAVRQMTPVAHDYFDFYLEGKPPSRRRTPKPKAEPRTPPVPLRKGGKPNVVMILADDLGWSDTTLFGTTKFYKTPNIQRLAKRGMTFTRAYSCSPLCSPTRASILTGLSPARVGITSPGCHLPKVLLAATPGKNAPPNKKAVPVNSATRLDTKYYTLAEALHDNGYATAHFGKWHLGAKPYSPLEHGFDIDVPNWPGPGPAGSYVAPWKFPDFDPRTPNEHIEDRMADEAVTFLEKNRDKPFFLEYWMFSVHAPFDAKRGLIAKYRKNIDPNDPQRSPTYAAMIESMDDAVGTLLDALDRLGLADNTIIVFASDNGGNMYNEVDGVPATSNAPLRGGKATMYEGGIRGPAIVVYPKLVEPGSRSDALIQSSDYYPTLLEMTDIEPKQGQKFDGTSIVPALRGKSLQRDAIFTYFPHHPRVPDWLPPSVSVHQGDWKLIRIFHGGDKGKHRWKLFDLKDDIGERKNLASKHPERVKSMDALIDEFLDETKAVLPTPNPKFDPSKYNLEDEGKAELKRSGSGRKPPRGKRGDPVAGWQPAGTCTLSVEKGALVFTSTGGDPHASSVLPKPVTGKTLTLHFTLTSTSSGRGQIFWQEQGVRPAFHRDRSTRFDVHHDGKPHDYSIELTPKNPVLAVRIDPSAGPGKLALSDVRLTTEGGRIVHRWKFAKP